LSVAAPASFAINRRLTSCFSLAMQTTEGRKSSSYVTWLADEKLLLAAALASPLMPAAMSALLAINQILDAAGSSALGRRTSSPALSEALRHEFGLTPVGGDTCSLPFHFELHS
jgi:hypothetical protein